MEYIEMILRGIAIFVIIVAAIGLGIAGSLVALVIFTRYDEKIK